MLYFVFVDFPLFGAKKGKGVAGHDPAKDFAAPPQTHPSSLLPPANSPLTPSPSLLGTKTLLPILLLFGFLPSSFIWFFFSTACVHLFVLKKKKKLCFSFCFFSYVCFLLSFPFFSFSFFFFFFF
eukprot:Rhum_TRINITY_DN14303_c34_g1::Rhum_TRINITY_DN14303_c34_g1_i1::g.80113::m.80113